MANALSAVTQANNEFNAALSKQKGSELDKEAFMLLLVTQFKYQDPLNPMEDKEFISQMSQFSSLEQLMNLNTSMNNLTNASNSQQMLNATSFIGKQVTIEGNAIGKVTDSAGQATITRFRYAPQDDVRGGVLTVRDAANNIVYSEELPARAGGVTYTFSWNGLTNAGTVAPDGVYTANLALLNAKGEAVLSDQVVDATVTGIVNDKNSVLLGLEGGQTLPLAGVRQVIMPQTVATQPGGANSSGTGSASGATGATGGTGATAANPV